MDILFFVSIIFLPIFIISPTPASSSICCTSPDCQRKCRSAAGDGCLRVGWPPQTLSCGFEWSCSGDNCNGQPSPPEQCQWDLPILPELLQCSCDPNEMRQSMLGRALAADGVDLSVFCRQGRCNFSEIKSDPMVYRLWRGQWDTMASCTATWWPRQGSGVRDYGCNIDPAMSWNHSRRVYGTGAGFIQLSCRDGNDCNNLRHRQDFDCPLDKRWWDGSQSQSVYPNLAPQGPGRNSLTTPINLPVNPSHIFRGGEDPFNGIPGNPPPINPSLIPNGQGLNGRQTFGANPGQQSNSDVFYYYGHASNVMPNLFTILIYVILVHLCVRLEAF